MHRTTNNVPWLQNLFQMFIFLLAAIAHRPSYSEPIRQRHPRSDHSRQLLHDVLKALEKATDFFSEDYSALNVDGLFGVRLAQGNIVGAARFCTQHGASCPDDLTHRLIDLNETIGTVANMALPYIKEEDPEYFKKFSPTIDSPYIVPYEPESIDKYVTEPGTMEQYSEPDGDRCLSSLMGTFQVHGRRVPKCTVTDECWDLMTKPNQSQYSITHQLLFFVMGQKTGCSEELNRIMPSRNLTSVKEQEKKFCGHIFGEMLKLAEGGRVNIIQQDLFLEQTVLCGTLGFSEFFPEEWIRLVLSWQNSKGCFTLPSIMIRTEARLQRVSEEQRHLIKLLEHEADAIDRSTFRGRKLLREKVLGDECLSHKSGLGFSALSVYLRYLVQTLYS